MGRPPLGKRPMTATEHQRRWRKRRRLGLVGRRPQRPVAKGDHQALTEELVRLTNERDQARAELARRGHVPDAPPRGEDFDDIRRAYIAALLRLPMGERAREMRVLSDALTADEIGTDRRRGHAVQTASDADLDDDLDAGLDDDIDD
jgi:hypothetical protein